MIGTTISHYEILELLGEGGMGVVYRARDTRLDRTVAIKIMRPEAAVHRERRERFIREAKAASALNHPNIVTIYDIDRDASAGAECDFIVMEHADEAALDELLAKRPLPIGEALGYAVQIARALAAAHGAGIVHRDVKPANVLLTKKGEAKLGDFGLAKLAEPQSGDDDASPTVSAGLRTEDGVVLGTPSYMSPEQAEGRPVDCRTDVFSFGSMLYEMLAGRRPFSGDSHLSIRKAVLTTNPSSIRTARPEIVPELERVVFRCLEKEREARYPSGAELLRDLEQAQRRLEARPPLWRRPRVAAPAALALVALVAAGVWLWVRSARIERARNALPEIARLAAEDESVAAYRLAKEVLPDLAGDSEAERLWQSLTLEYSLNTVPDGARISWKDYAEPESAWELLGTTPIEKVRLPLVLLRWRIEKAGFEAMEFARWGFSVGSEPFALHTAGSQPKDMVWVPGGAQEIEGKTVKSDGFWLDEFEVTNREFQAFVDSGGYRNREYWKVPFDSVGRDVSWEDAMRRFVDRTGRPGPATWEVGSYPAGEEDYPVRGVSWYEAAAFAEFAGKSLPTVHHWLSATDRLAPTILLTLSNFEGKGPASVGRYQGMGPYGTYDMAGNVKEWCWNGSGEMRYTLGGGWDEPVYMYRSPHAQSAIERRENYGFRCAKYEKPPAAELLAPIDRAWRDYTREKPVDDGTFRILENLYVYDRTPLEPVVESLSSASPHWKMEKITVNAAYGGEKLIAYLFLPTNAAPPYQTVVYWPGSGAQILPRLLEPELMFFDFVIRSGRAVLHPIYKGTYDRRLQTPPAWPSRAYRDLEIQQVQDAGRSVDYLETRDDIDKDKLAYYGLSWGAVKGLVVTALDRRFKAGVLLAGGLYEFDYPGMPEIDEFNFAPRVATPTLMLNGREDFRFPLELSQKPLFELLGTAAADKRHVLFEGGHIPPRLPLVQPTLDWLDRYLGRVATGR
jgi:serine/threonine protein kinase/formylglycine-generating enzyme required for sulfatase activity